jgi:hypothetical protein
MSLVGVFFTGRFEPPFNWLSDDPHGRFVQVLVNSVKGNAYVYEFAGLTFSSVVRKKT